MQMTAEQPRSATQAPTPALQRSAFYQFQPALSAGSARHGGLGA